MVVASYSNVGSIGNLDPLGTPIDVRISCVSERRRKETYIITPRRGGHRLWLGRRGCHSGTRHRGGYLLAGWWAWRWSSINIGTRRGIRDLTRVNYR